MQTETRRIYLDNAATTPLDPQVLEAMLPYLSNHFGNPSSIHAYGRETRAAIEKARKKIASLLMASPGEIFFTSGGTEANNMALRCSIRDLGVERIITSPIEHHAVTHTVEALSKEGLVSIEWVPLNADGTVLYEALESLLQNNKQKTLVSLMHANNEIGVLLDMERVSQLCQTYGAYFHCDTVQTITHYPLNLNQIKVHFISGAAHKFHGPKGIGFIYINAEAHLNPLIYGGAQERNLRAGTENLYGIVGMAKAMEIACDEMEHYTAYISDLRSYMQQQLEMYIPGVAFNSPEQGLYTVLNVLFPPHPKNELLLINLDIEGIACSGGSACSSGSNTGSHVINFLQTPDQSASVRFSFSKMNTKEDIDFAIDKIRKIFTA